MLLESTKSVKVPAYAEIGLVDINNRPIRWTILYTDVRYDARGRPMSWKDRFGRTHQFR